MSYIVKTSSLFQKDFAKLDAIIQSRVLVVLEKMKSEPFLQVKKLRYVSVGIFRRRIGDYRLRFDVVSKEIYLYCIRHRKDVYKKS